MTKSSLIQSTVFFQMIGLIIILINKGLNEQFELINIVGVVLIQILLTSLFVILEIVWFDDLTKLKYSIRGSLNLSNVEGKLL